MSKHISSCLQEAVKLEKDMLTQLYSPSVCRTRDQLQQLMDNELGELIKIKKQIIKMSKEAVLEGLRREGVAYPSILWIEQIDPKLPDFMLHSLHKQAPVVSLPQESGKIESGKNAENKRTVIYAVTAAGVVLTITGLTLSPVNMLLLSMGVVLTATGLVLLVKEVYFDNKALRERKPSVVPGANTEAEAAQIADLLKKIWEQNGDVIDRWNHDLYNCAVDAMGKTEAKK